MSYPFNEIEKKWQKHWADNKTFRAENKSEKPKYYALDMFPYPSGAGLHVGHPLGYIASDIVSRYKRLKGFNVLHPMGYDSFGLPAEQYAIQTGQHPEKTTRENIARYREQMDKIGFSFDWDREVRTSDPNYYKWTQWIFIKLFNSWYNPETDKAEPIEGLIQKLQSQKSKVGAAGQLYDQLNEKEKSDVLMQYRLAYLNEAWVNWCPQLGTVLANEEVKDGVSERGGYPVERKLMPQWSLRITAYANRLLNDLEGIDWSESIKESQRNWIGKSEGSSLKFSIASPHPQPLSKGEGGVAPNKSGEYPGYHTAKKEIWGKLKENSKENRKDPTPAEKILWEHVRDSKLGYKIRRQHVIDQFIVDFVCLEKKLIIEVDGSIHLTQAAYDSQRTYMLQDIGYRLIRFSNEEVILQTDWVCQKIAELLNAPFSFGEGRGDEACIEVFTTRPDTIFGVTFLTLAPESELVPQLTTAENKKAVEEYVHYAKNRSERERQADVKKVTGQFTGAYAIHPFSGEKLPIWVGDYVLAGYGTGAVMGVPAHDSRDHAFAKHFGLPIKQVVEAPKDWDIQKESFDAKEGKCINSDLLNGLHVKDTLKKIIAEIEKRGLGKGKTQFRLRDAIFGRQRYWGEPIPIYYKDGLPYAMEENELPLVLPEVDKYLPTEDGEPPLARAKDWKYKGKYEYEKTTMPGWAGSSWYFLRYMDPKNEKEFASRDAINYWQNVDLYIGGSEHATGHLLYVRFWTKFLYDLGLIPVIEPAQKLINQGMIQGTSCLIYIYSFAKEAQNWSNPDSSPNSQIVSLNDLPRVLISKGIYERYEKNCLTEADKTAIDRVRHKINEKIQQNHPDSSIQLDLAFEMPMHVDVNIVKGNELDVEAFKKWRSDFLNAEFVFEDTKFLCGNEVEKMSKRWYNVVTPDSICSDFGADTLRLYEMFLGPLEQSKPWNTAGITGVSGFLNKFWRLFHEEHKVSNIERREEYKVSEEAPTKAELKILHKTIKKIQQDIENYSFNTSVSSFMIATNELTDLKCNKRAVLEPMVILLSSFAPHIAEELWEKLGHQKSVTFASFPSYDEALMADDSFAYPISFNGKMRFNLELSLSLSPAEIEKEVLANEQSKKFLEGKQPKKVIVVPKRIVNIVI